LDNQKSHFWLETGESVLVAYLSFQPFFSFLNSHIYTQTYNKAKKTTINKKNNKTTTTQQQYNKTTTIQQQINTL